MQYLDAQPYAADHEFTNDRLNQTRTPLDIYRWLVNMAYGTDDLAQRMTLPMLDHQHWNTARNNQYLSFTITMLRKKWPIVTKRRAAKNFSTAP